MKQKYISINVCVKCENELSTREMFHANGTCCYCGNTNNSTIVDTCKKTIKVDNKELADVSSQSNIIDNKKMISAILYSVISLIVTVIIFSYLCKSSTL